MQTNVYYKAKFMTKKEMLHAIEHAKHIHLEQMNKIKSEIAGKKVENPTALGKMECECGIWFYEHEEEMKNVCGLQLFERLDKSHERWHIDYANIYNLLFKEEKKGLFSKIMGSSNRSEMKLDKAKLYFSELQKDTEALLIASESAIRRVSALNNSKFS